MHFTGFQAGPHQIQRHPVPVHISFERMSGLMGHDFHIVFCSIEIGKDKRHMIIRQIRAVTAAFLPLGAEHIHKFHIQHFPEEFTGFGR